MKYKFQSHLKLSKLSTKWPVHLIDEDVLEVEIFSIRGTFAYKKLIHRQIQRFLLAKKLAVCVLSGGEFDVLGNVDAEKRALSVLYYQALPGPNICSVLQTDFGYNPPNLNKKILVDAEHALAAKCVLGESGLGHVFSKIKQACSVATNGSIQFPNEREVVKKESSKNIGPIHHIMVRRQVQHNSRNFGKVFDEPIICCKGR